ncbi:hypothetical protein [Siccirubricoccus phaeus]|uniref:hypothetical protein n=1 Tax=Siccirubricoccus phaeus TaxID=2595053 RepID=UPI0011F32734|nr:hypothetical protein [Siccirubricoccus phaeus]
MNPFAAAALAWQAGFVFTARSLQLWAEPASAQAMLLRYALEKQRAFEAGALAAGQAMLAGAAAPAVMAAAMAPAERRVRANLRRLTKA